MQILTISDEIVPTIYSLNIKQRFRDVQLILGCGDLPYYYIEYAVTMLGVPCYYVPGNHDTPEVTHGGQTIEEARGAVDIDGASICHKGLILAGLGGSIRYKSEGGNQYTESEMMQRVWRLAPRLLFNRLRYGRYMDVFISHAPPLGIHNGPDFPHRGFRAFLWLMDRFHPRYFIHGHIHLSYGFDQPIESQYHTTQVINTAGYRLLKLQIPELERNAVGFS
jgi:Icc-related predicted phosphoesterase